MLGSVKVKIKNLVLCVMEMYSGYVISMIIRKWLPLSFIIEDATVFFSDFSTITLKNTQYYYVGSGNFI